MSIHNFLSSSVWCMHVLIVVKLEAGQSGNVGIVFYASSNNSLDELIQNGTDPPYIVVMSAQLFEEYVVCVHAVIMIVMVIQHNIIQFWSLMHHASENEWQVHYDKLLLEWIRSLKKFTF